jgi:pilus assembly protein CpaC
MKRHIKVLLAAMALAVVGALPPLVGGALAQATAIKAGSQTFSIEVNEGQLIRLDRPAASVFIANSDIADVSVRSPRMVYMFGLRPGETTLYALDATDNVVANARVVVSHNLSRLNTALANLLPAGGVTARSVDGGIVLSGAVPNATDSENIRRLTARFVGEGEDIINRVAVTQPNQVNLRVRIADVSRTVVNELGFSWEAIFDGTDVFFQISTGLTPALSGLGPGDAAADSNFGTFGSYDGGDVDVNNLIDALASDGLVTILAEPNLTALSGETASFLAGGEFPVPIVSDGSTSISFREFGVSLAFTPTILSDNRISMRVRPEVSELSTVGAIEVDGLEIPGLSTRRAETTVELASGQSFAIAGLRHDARRQDYDDIPGLGSIPLLGALFQQNSLTKSETEVLIVVTPYIVRPTNTQPPLPTDPYLAARETTAGANANVAGNPTQTVPLNNNLASTGGSLGQSGFILE